MGNPTKPLGTGQAYVENDPVTGAANMLRTSSGIACLYVYDGIGNPVALLTDFQTTSYSYTYDPCGLPTLTSSSGGNGVTQNPYLFKGGIQDRATGFVKFGGRWYDPTTGRWTQQDTLDAPLDPANANRYMFAGDDPINNGDPLGLCAAGASTAANVFGVISSAAALVGILAAGVAAVGAAPLSGGVSLLGFGAAAVSFSTAVPGLLIGLSCG